MNSFRLAVALVFMQGLSPMDLSAACCGKKAVKMEIDATPLFIAVMMGRAKDVIPLSTSHPEDLEIEGVTAFTPLMHACFYGDFNMVAALLAAGAQVNGTSHLDDAKNTPLMMAVVGKYKKDITLKIIKLLVENGADLSAKNKSGYTAFALALAKNSRSKVSKYLSFLVRERAKCS